MPRVRIKPDKKTPRPDPEASPAPDPAVLIVRPQKTLTRELIEQVCVQIKRGLTFDCTWDLLGVQSTTAWKWKRQGEKFLNGDGQPPDWELFGEFVLRTRQAFAEYRAALSDNLHLPGVQWVQFISILERRDRVNYGRSSPMGGAETEYDADERYD